MRGGNDRDIGEKKVADRNREEVAWGSDIIKPNGQKAGEIGPK